MIESIHIKNAIVFENLNLEFHKGLNVFSGASGSGKSVFMESLLGLFGLKDSNATQIQGILTQCPINLEDYGIDNENEIFINIIKKDKTRYFINNSLIAKKNLQEILSNHIKHISLKNSTELLSSNLLRVFDTLITSKEKDYHSLLLQMQIKFDELQTIKQSYNELLKEEKNIQELREFATFEINKIQSLNPKVGEYEELMQLKKNFSKKEKIQELIAQSLDILQNIHIIQNTLQILEKTHPTFDESILEIKDILHNEDTKLQELDTLNPEEILDRISKLADLNHRYGSIEEALIRLQFQQEKLKEYDNISFNKEKLLDNQKQIEKECILLAKEISHYRIKYIKDFTNELEELCKLLKLKDIQVLLKENSLSHTGSQEISILLKNTQIQNLSMGEYNRLRLAVMCLEANFSDKTGILILDEIDANLSGEESDGVAKVLKQLATSYQIFAISHQPHIPALADHHYLVIKKDNKSFIQSLDTEGKIQEIARMISGSNITKEAIEFAKKRLNL